MPITIRILRGEGEETPRDLELTKKTILIGRGSAEDVRLTNDSVSRRHCVIERRDNEWVLIDEGSANGTLVNGSVVKEARPLRHGDAIEVGEVLLIVGIDRPLEQKRKAVSQEKQAAGIATGINTGLLIVALAICLVVAVLVWNARSFVVSITRPIPIALENEKKLNVLDGFDRKDVRFDLPARRLFSAYFENGIYYPVPEWDLSDVWTAAVEGKQPRVMDGLDVDLAGGNQIALSSYFFVTATYWAHDANDPYGRLHFDLEGWGGLGPRNGQTEAPLIRFLEFPHYLRLIELYPSNIQPFPVEGLEGGEIASFHYARTLDPSPQGSPLVYPWFRRVLAGNVLPELAPRQVVFEGRCFTFFHNGCRYMAIVRGSRSMLSRFPGGIDALAEAYFKSISFPDAPRQPDDDPAELAAKAREKMTFMEEAFQKKLHVLKDLRYRDLMGIREVLLAMQNQPQPLPEEDPYRRAYFELRDRAQQELEFALQKIYEGRLLQQAPEGEAQLDLIRTFLGNYPPPTMKPGDYGYPDWARFYEAAVDRRPYVNRRK